MTSKKLMYTKLIQGFPFPLALPLNFVITGVAKGRGICFDQIVFDCPSFGVVKELYRKRFEADSNAAKRAFPHLII